MMKTVPVKKTCQSSKALTRLIVLGLALSIQSAAFATENGSNGGNLNLPYLHDTVHSIEISKSLSSKKHKIRLYPDARQQVLFFSANGENGKVYQLFLFDMDGRLVNQTQIRNRETTVLTNISEGNFLFEVFTDDERIENGQLRVR